MNKPITIYPAGETPPPLPVPSSSSKGSYWSWTFGLTTFPFFFWGCPFYLLTGRRFSSSRLAPSQPISSTFVWWKAIFDLRSTPFLCLLSIVLLIPTIFINIYVAYKFGNLFYTLFIAGTYKMQSFYDIFELIGYLPVVVPLDYVWFKGFKITNMVMLLNDLYEAHDGAGCPSSFRIRLVGMLFATICVHTVHYVSDQKYDVADSSNTWESAQTILELSLNVFVSFLLPLYCTFCYAVMFQLYLIKAFIYKLISQRILPNTSHLSVVKTLYTKAADGILTVNGLFSLYLSIGLLFMVVDSVIAAETLWKGLAKISLTGSPIMMLLAMLTKEGSQDPTEATEEEKFSQSDVREMNAEIACIMITYGLIYFTIRQSISVNDCARELNVWLNDLVTGGGGTDVEGILASLGVLKGGESDGNQNKMIWQPRRDSEELVWAKSTITGNGHDDDEFFRKFHNLKSYIHVRMQLEKPALLSIALVGVIAPSLKGRLKNYRIFF